MNDNYDGMNQSDSDSSNTYGSSPYQDPSQTGQTPSESNQQFYEGQDPYSGQPINNGQNPYDNQQFSNPINNGQAPYDGQQFDQPMNDQQDPYSSQPYNQPMNNGQDSYNDQFYNQPVNNEQSPYSQPTNQQENSYDQSNYIPNDYSNQNYSPYASNQNQSNQFSSNEEYAQNTMNQMPNQQYNQNGYTTYENTPETATSVSTKTKKSHKWMWGFTAIPILAIAAVLCFLFIPSFKNFVFKNVLGTTKYYEHIEISCTEKVRDEFSSLPKTKKIDLSKGASAKGKLTLKLDSSLTSQLGFDVNDFTCDYSTSVKDKKAVSSYKMMYQDKELGTFEMYQDTEAGKMYLKVPQLSDQYIDYSAFLDKYYSSASDFSSDFKSKIKNLSTKATAASTFNYSEVRKLMQKLMTQLDSDTTDDLIKEYLKFIFDSIGDKGAIKLNDKEVLRVGNLEEDCEAFTITLTPAQVVDVMKEVLTKAKDDKKLLDIVQNVMGDTSAYTSTIDKLLGEISDSNPLSAASDNSFEMKVYTDGEQILGRKFIFKTSGNAVATFEYGMLSTKDQTSFNVAVTPEDASKQVSITCDSKKNADKHSGTMTFAAEDQNFTIDFKDFKINDDAIIEGSLSTTVSSLYNVSLNLSNNNGSQGITAAVNVAGKELASVTAEATKEELKEFNYPEISDDKTVSITDNASLATYLKNSKLSSFLDTIISTFNLPSTLNGTTLANEIISKLEGGSSLPDPDSNNNDSNSNNDNSNNSSGSLNPSDYNLPSGTKIDEDGSYSYNLSDAELADLKKKPSDYQSFDKTYDQVKSFASTLGKTFCGNKAYESSDSKNNVIGNVKDKMKIVNHSITYSTMDSGAYNYVDVVVDSLTNKVVQVSINTQDSKKLMASLKGVCSQLGVAELPSDTVKKIISLMAAKKDTTESFKLKDYYAHLFISGSGKDTEYTIDFTKGDTLY